MQKGQILVFILAGILILAGIVAGVFYLTEQGSFPQLVPVFRPIKIMLLAKGSDKYCRQFGPSSSDCPSDCEVRPSCPVCADIGCRAKDYSKTPYPTPTASPAANGIDENSPCPTGYTYAKGGLQGDSAPYYCTKELKSSDGATSTKIIPMSPYPTKTK